MQRSDGTFHLVDLASQAEAVQTWLVGRSLEEKVAWLASRGQLSVLPAQRSGAKRIYSFESNIGIQCLVFFDGDDLVFIGDHTTRVVPLP